MIIGTAGHIDHGKTTLIKALTGADTDRLQEEKKRGISIDLGFAEFKLPSGIIAGVVDVPGHEKFIKNMLAGATGIDLVLLVIASDDGIMPQTEEHLSIIKLLGVKDIVVALSKADLAEDEWLELVKDEVKEFLEERGFNNVPIISVSPITGQGIKELLGIIDQAAQNIKDKELDLPIRLPIDRVFTIAGAGTIITGTLWEGKLSVGTDVDIKPGLKRAKVRSIQVHNKKVDKADAGQRVALNLTGVEKEEIHRGQVVIQTGYLSESYIIDTKLELLSSWVRNLKNRERIRFHHGTQEVMGRVVLLNQKELEPGQSCYARIYMEDEILPKYKDRFVIRSYSPLYTIGGGLIINSHPQRKVKDRNRLIEELKKLDQGDPKDIIRIKINQSNFDPLSLTEITKNTELKEEIVIEIIKELVKGEDIIGLDDGFYFSKINYQEIRKKATEILKEYHQKEPLSKGLNKETFKSKLFHNKEPVQGELLLANMVKEGIISISGEVVFSPEYKSELREEDQQVLSRISQLLRDKPFSPPDLKNLSAKLGMDTKKTFTYLKILKDKQEIVQIKGDLYFIKEAFEQAKDRLVRYIKQNGSITPAEFRDQLNTTRKYIVPLLEYFDSIKLTIRQGDQRVLR